MTLYGVFQAATAFLRVVSLAIFIYVALSWLRPRGQWYVWLASFIRPFVAPFRRLSAWITGRFRIPLDFSCWFAIVGLNLVGELLWWLYRVLRFLR